MPTNNLGQSDIATHTTNILNKEVYHSKRIFLYIFNKNNKNCVIFYTLISLSMGKPTQRPI